MVMYHGLCELHSTAECTCECWKYYAQCNTSDLCITKAIQEFLQKNKTSSIDTEQYNKTQNTPTSATTKVDKEEHPTSIVGKSSKQNTVIKM
jgi:hypothetical protein